MDASERRVRSVIGRVHGRSVRVRKRHRISLYTIGLGVWLSGAVWLIYHYFLTNQGELGPQINSLQPWWLKVHGAFAFAAIWIFGLFWGIHIEGAWPYRKRRWSGSVLAFLFFFLVVTGYLLYYVGDDEWRNVVSVLHWSVGLGAPAGYFWHRWKRRRRSSGQPAAGRLSDSAAANP